MGRGLSLNEVGRRIQRAPRVPSCDGSARGVVGEPTPLRAVRFFARTPAEVGRQPAPAFAEAAGQQGPQAHGYRTQLWTTARIAAVIRRELGGGLPSCDHVNGRLMHSLHWSPQMPETRALERDEPGIERWKRKEWPRVKKTLRGWALHLKSSPMNRAFCWLPWWHRNLGTPGLHSPFQRHRQGRRDKISVISRNFGQPSTTAFGTVLSSLLPTQHRPRRSVPVFFGSCCDTSEVPSSFCWTIPPRASRWTFGKALASASTPAHRALSGLRARTQSR